MSTKKKQFSGQVTKTRAIKIFEALGFKTAGKWDVAKLQRKLLKLDTLIEGTDLDKKNLKKVNEILSAQAKGRKVIVVDVEDVAAGKQREKEVKDAAAREVKRKADQKTKAKAKEKAETKKTAKKAKAKKTTKKAVAASDKKKKPGIDKFGGRTGTIKAKINAVLTKKPKTMQQLLKDAKVENQQSGHLKNLIEEGYVVKIGKGYALV